MSFGEMERVGFMALSKPIQSALCRHGGNGATLQILVCGITAEKLV
jgi:hypothetical protein